MDDAQQNPIVTPDENTTEPKVLATPLKPAGIVTKTEELPTVSGKDVDKSDRAKGGQLGNTNNTKWKTPEERQDACKKVCEELRLGYPREYLYTAAWKTINRYMQEYPFDFPPDMIEEAEKDGIRRLLSIGYGGMAGKVPGFNSRTWEFIIQNRSKWKLRHDTTTNDKELPTPILGATAPKDNKE